MTATVLRSYRKAPPPHLVCHRLLRRHGDTDVSPHWKPEGSPPFRSFWCPLPSKGLLKFGQILVLCIASPILSFFLSSKYPTNTVPFPNPQPVESASLTCSCSFNSPTRLPDFVSSFILPQNQASLQNELNAKTCICQIWSIKVCIPLDIPPERGGGGCVFSRRVSNTENLFLKTRSIDSSFVT